MLSDKSNHKWNEITITIFNNIFNLKYEIEEEIFSILILNLQQNVEQFSTNLKFSTLLLTLISKYSSELTNHLLVFKQIVLKCNNYLTKVILQKIDKIK